MKTFASLLTKFRKIHIETLFSTWNVKCLTVSQSFDQVRASYYTGRAKQAYLQWNHQSQCQQGCLKTLGQNEEEGSSWRNKLLHNYNEEDLYVIDFMHHILSNYSYSRPKEHDYDNANKET